MEWAGYSDLECVKDSNYWSLTGSWSRWVFSILSWALQQWLLVDGWTCDFSLRHWCLTMRFLLFLRCGSKRTISDLLKRCSVCECDGAHNMPLKQRCSDHRGTQQPWAIHSVPLFLFSHLHGFSQTWAKFCLRIPFMACFSLHWSDFGQHKECLKYGQTLDCGKQYVCGITSLAGVVILH